MNLRPAARPQTEDDEDDGNNDEDEDDDDESGDDDDGTEGDLEDEGSPSQEGEESRSASASQQAPAAGAAQVPQTAPSRSSTKILHPPGEALLGLGPLAPIQGTNPVESVQTSGTCCMKQAGFRTRSAPSKQSRKPRAGHLRSWHIHVGRNFNARRADDEAINVCMQTCPCHRVWTMTGPSASAHGRACP